MSSAIYFDITTIMFKKDLFTDDHSTIDGFNLQGGQKFYSEIRSSRNQYGRLDRVDNEVKSISRLYCCVNERFFVFQR